MTTVGARSLKERFQAIAWLVVDVDGVLTRGEITYGWGSGPAEIKAFHVRDGSGLKRWHAAGLRTAIITGRSSPLVDRRAAELGISRVYQGAADKLPALLSLLKDECLAAEVVCYVGDDTPDVPPMTHSGLAVAVADACAEARAAAHYQANAAGGRGAVREVIDRILRCQDKVPAGA